jgi:hypothetical protein
MQDMLIAAVEEELARSIHKGPPPDEQLVLKEIPKIPRHTGGVAVIKNGDFDK